MGIVIGIGQTKPQMPYDQFYGIEWDVTVSNPKAKRIGKLELHASLPVQSLMRRCVLRDNGEVAYYLDANDSTKKEGGAPAKLDGTDGQVMVEVPAFYVKFESEGNKRRCLISLHNLPGFTKWEKLYISAYEATIQRSTSKLSSVVNATADYRGGDNNASKDGKFGSLLGRPASNFTLKEARLFARNRGSKKWTCYAYQAHLELFWLYAVEYATFNSQDEFTASLDDSGCKQGGLGGGVTSFSSSSWSKMSYMPFVQCGATNSIGNHTGIAGVVASSLDSEMVNVPSYRGVENPFGHIAKLLDGVKLTVSPSGDAQAYVYTSPSDYGGGGIELRRSAGLFTKSSGYLRDISLGNSGDIVPVAVGAGSSTFFCDKVAAPTVTGREYDTFIVLGGISNNGLNAGMLCVDIAHEAIQRKAYFGTRLCYLP